MKPLMSLIMALLFVVIADPAFAQTTVVKQLNAENGSGESGLVILQPNPAGDGVLVTIAIPPASEPAGGSQPAHIHTGTCTNLGGVYKPLTNVVDGQSVTNVVGVTISDLTSGTYAVNVHMSVPQMSTYVSCADLSGGKM